MFKRFARVFFPIAVVGLLLNMYFGDRISSMSLVSAVERHVGFVCGALDSGRVTAEDICQTPLPEIEELKHYFERIREKDQAWYRERGWEYYPRVRCEDSDISFEMSGLKFACDGEDAVVRTSQGAVSGVAYAQSAPADVVPGGAPKIARPCFETNDGQHSLIGTSVSADGTVVLDDKQNVTLIGVALPKENKRAPKGMQCLEHALQYLQGQIKDRSVTSYPEDILYRDEKHRLPVYVVLRNGQLLNREVLRLGLGMLQLDYDGEIEVGCKQLLEDSERYARVKKLGMWGDSCK